ncbi:unnamed protein product [Allacma fusca]|uniref:Uncharacterized protein n=1 Tax=Allacma fusca TaxID=39272 RepID=A0A8J2PLI9_9HEXA|nr:unnamed protein product [Allacma fusca]
MNIPEPRHLTIDTWMVAHIFGENGHSRTAHRLSGRFRSGTSTCEQGNAGDSKEDSRIDSLLIIKMSGPQYCGELAQGGYLVISMNDFVILIIHVRFLLMCPIVADPLIFPHIFFTSPV